MSNLIQRQEFFVPLWRQCTEEISVERVLCVQSDTVQAAFNCVATTIMAYGHRDLIKDQSGKILIYIDRQTRGYRNKDLPPKPEKALPASVYRWCLKHSYLDEEKAWAHLLAGAFFFSMRSCRYSKSGNSKNRRTIM
eukprot:2119739-Ditylum_brightwellii.AAC.1